jgi:tRNA-splicing ligase RtcB
MAAVKFLGAASIISDAHQAARLLRGLNAAIPAMRHRKETITVMPDSLVAEPLSHPRLEKLKQREAQAQFGTLGRGNHFVEFEADEEDTLWLLIHSGSRAMGQAIREHHLAHATRSTSGLRYLAAETPTGQAYLHDAAWAERYAEANRQKMVQAAVHVMEDLFSVTADWSSAFSCHHNHVRQERHFDSVWWVHRKGALWAGHGAQGIIPGSMGAPSYHVEGRGHEPSLQSSSHGAGRVLSRTEACHSIPRQQLLREMTGVWFDHRHVDRLRDEAPSAYKDIARVMRAQRDLTRIVRIVRPVLSYKAAS